MSKNMHGFEIVVNADRSDWGIKWGLAPIGDPLCWCYECSMTRPTKRAVDEGESAPLQAESTTEHLPIEEADTTPALRN